MPGTIAKHVSKKAEAATAPFQYALSTKARCEYVAHILQTLTDVIDGIGAYDLISRNAMCRDFSRDGDRVLQFVRCFYRSPSTYMWEDEMGSPKIYRKGREGSRVIP